MKKILLLVIVMSFVFFSCKNKNTDNSDEKTADVSNVEQIDKNVVTSDNDDEMTKDPIELKYLPTVIDKQSKQFKDKFYAYIDMLSKNVKNDKEIKKVLDARDSLIRELYIVMDKFYYDNELEYDEWEKYDNELASIGFYCIYAEGMLVDIDAGEILTDEIDKYASEELKLYAEFNYKYSESMGGEYPFSSLTGYFDALLVAEKLYKKYKSSDYYKLIEEKHQTILKYATDIHKVGDGDYSYYYGDLNFSDYPFMSSGEDLKAFVKEHPESMYADIVKKILGNISQIDNAMNSDYIFEVYAVTVEKCKNREEMLQKSFDYINNGKDIVHTLTCKDGNTDVYYCVYRFYSEKSKAKDALSKVKDFPEAKIVKIGVVDEFDDYVIIN